MIVSIELNSLYVEMLGIIIPLVTIYLVFALMICVCVLAPEVVDYLIYKLREKKNKGDKR